MLDGSTAAKAIPPTPNSEVLTDFKVKPSPWVDFEGIRMSLASANHIKEIREDVHEMRARRLGVAAE